MSFSQPLFLYFLINHVVIISVMKIMLSDDSQIMIDVEVENKTVGVTQAYRFLINLIFSCMPVACR